MATEARRRAEALPEEQRVCHWCGRDAKWDSRWEFVNGRHWYHQVCINLLDMVS